MRAQSDALDVLANNLANVNTAGFKEARAFHTLLKQSLESDPSVAVLDDAVNGVVTTQSALNPSDGSLTSTNRDLDIAITGDGFLAVQAPQGTRYTRNGNLHLNANSVLTTSEGFPVIGASGNPITLGPGRIAIGEKGSVSLEGAQVDSLKLVRFDDLSRLEREGNSLVRSLDGQNAERPSDAMVRSGYLEQSNVNAVASVVRMLEIMRHFEAMQKSVNMLMNDINAKAIERLGR